MKHLALIFIVFILGNKLQEAATTLQSNTFSNQNLKQEVVTKNFISVQESLILSNLDFLKNDNLEAITNNQMPPQTVRLRFYTTTTQEQINESLDLINPISSLRCVDSDDPIYIIFIPGKGRGSGSGGSRNDDNVIKSITYIQSYTYGEICN